MAPQNANTRVPRTIVPRISPLQTNSEAYRNARYSYTSTPTELQRPVFEQFSPADSTIEESPISPHDRTSFAERTSYPQVPAPSVSGLQNGSLYPFQTAQEVHPTHRAPYKEGVPPVQYLESRHNLHEPPQSPGPLPIKMDDEPIAPGLAIIHQSEHDEQNNPNHAPPAIVPDAHHPLAYSPYSISGPNADVHEAHRPGQVPHPNASVMPHWKHRLCEFDTLCCTGIFCPCIVYGKTQYRLSKKAKKQEPTDLLGYDPCNSSCGIMAVACGFQWVLAALQRNSIRRQYKLEGRLGDDCVKGLCCCCCVIMQDEREVRDREEQIRKQAGPAIGPYAAPGTMTYAPPPR